MRKPQQKQLVRRNGFNGRLKKYRQKKTDDIESDISSIRSDISDLESRMSSSDQ